MTDIETRIEEEIPRCDTVPKAEIIKSQSAAPVQLGEEQRARRRRGHRKDLPRTKEEKYLHEAELTLRRLRDCAQRNLMQASRTARDMEKCRKIKMYMGGGEWAKVVPVPSQTNTYYICKYNN